VTTLTLPYPVSANRYWATRVVKPKGRPAMAITYVTPEANEYKARVQAIALSAGIDKPLLGRVKLDIWLFPNRPQDWQTRQRKLGAEWDNNVMCIDLDNANKVLLDALKDVAFEDDKRVFQLLAQRMEPDERGARVVVRISPIVATQPQGALL
jgi:crossover junction endodeoxyribonuclease RusA